MHQRIARHLQQCAFALLDAPYQRVAAKRSAAGHDDRPRPGSFRPHLAAASRQLHRRQRHRRTAMSRPCASHVTSSGGICDASNRRAASRKPAISAPGSSAMWRRATRTDLPAGAAGTRRWRKSARSVSRTGRWSGVTRNGRARFRPAVRRATSASRSVVCDARARCDRQRAPQARHAKQQFAIRLVHIDRETDADCAVPRRASDRLPDPACRLRWPTRCHGWKNHSSRNSQSA